MMNPCKFQEFSARLLVYCTVVSWFCQTVRHILNNTALTQLLVDMPSSRGDVTGTPPHHRRESERLKPIRTPALGSPENLLSQTIHLVGESYASCSTVTDKQLN